MLRLLFLASLLVTAAGAQEIYKVVNQDGSITYTDKPSADARPVELGPDNRMHLPTVAKTPAQSSKKNNKQKPKPVLEIISPAPEATIRNNAGNLTIAARVKDSDKQGSFNLFINNQFVMEQRSPTFKLTGINRGAHTFYITHTNNTGKTLASTSPQTFYLHQASRLINN